MTTDERSGAGRRVPAGAQPDRLAEAAQSCRGCELWRGATQTVFGEGSSPARVMLVGEQPGDREDLTGEPFVGPAGATLDRALAAAGIARGGHLPHECREALPPRRARQAAHPPRRDRMAPRDRCIPRPCCRGIDRIDSGPGTSRSRRSRGVFLVARSACCRTVAGPAARALGGRTAEHWRSAARHARVVSTICPPAASHVMYSLFAPQGAREAGRPHPSQAENHPHLKSAPSALRTSGSTMETPPPVGALTGSCLGREDPGQSI